ncbi:PREDICTED: F-box/FBD/LRR-repeat protein At1g13570-like [Ipomoea nil]|uniref:F-box/FBD/LRR-repeat protein At1g13570-like n=1 Tax=Ipomoea nil TaxID=35883 RepID=UPI000900C4F3|nr:PREDICTED: F-box/FBD/LRR-repeat protein At1g13570-like [Ipomoea nil]XP_019156736.1 PREDICTED: F-box/FBD/LRR-repeat protein At1g13570-like [Ipomoea nil]
MAGKDRISELPLGILDNILGFLPIQDAARTAILSSFWKDIWLSLTKLNFGYGFINYIRLKYAEGGKLQLLIFDVIYKILMRHSGPIHKIVLDFSEEEFEFNFNEEFDLEDIPNLSNNLKQWFLLLTQNGVEEIDISASVEAQCRVPNCIFSCPTLKRLKLSTVPLELINCVLPNVTSLCLDCVDFEPTNRRDYVYHLPMLEDLSFVYCYGIFDFNIVAPKLGSLKIDLPECFCYDFKEFGVLPASLDLRSISSLDLGCETCCFETIIGKLTRVGHAPALNIELLKLAIYPPYNINNFAFIHLLRACPKLCELDICHLEFLKLNPEDFVLMEELSSVARTLKMLRTLKFSHFNGWRSEMQSIKVFLAYFPGIEKVVIVRRQIRYDNDKEFKIMQELLRFPRASTKAEIFYIKES